MVIPVRTRILALIALIMLCFLAGLLILQQAEERRANIVFEDRKTEKRRLVEQLVELQGQPPHTFVYDYSFWDDMVSFVERPDSTWARINLDAGLETYQTSAAWVFRPDGSAVYATFQDRAEPLAQDSTIVAHIRKTLAGISFAHFFVQSPVGILEVRTAPIQPSTDDERITAARGYFVTAQLWDLQFLGRLASAASCQFAIVREPTFLSDTCQASASSGIITFCLPLKGWNDEPVSYLRATNVATIYLDLIRTSERQTLIVLMFTVVISALLLVSLTLWVSSPLKRVEKALESGDHSEVARLQGMKSEFQQIGDLLADSLKQKQQLKDEIAERNRIADALRESQRALETLMTNLPGMAYRCKNDPDWTMDFVSGGAVDLTGYQPDDLVGNKTVSYGDLILEEDRQMVWDGVQQAVESRKPFRLVYRLCDLHRSTKWVLEHGRGIYSQSGDLLAIEGVMLDISDRIAAENEREALQNRLNRVQRMESLAILAGGVAHDLNNLLGPVVGYPDLILMRLPADSPVRDQVEMIARSAQQAVDVIQDLLTLARRGRYEMKPISLNDVVLNYLKSPSCHEQQERHRTVELITHLNPSIGPILGSSTHLLKVIMNLVVNAFDAMSAGGNLTITTSQQRIHKLLGGYEHIETGEYVMLSIADTGSGIEAKDLPKIFEPYYSKKAMGRSGTGLGLAVVYGIIKDHGGYYDVFSQVGVGTEFVLYFPVTRETLMEESVSLANYRGTESVLIVDDVAEQRKLAADILTAMGYRVRSVANGREAVAFLKTHEADIVVLDMIMEKDFDGLDTYREVLGVRPNQKAIIVSGFSATERIQEALRLGASQYVRKPYTRQSLCKAIRESLDEIPRPVTHVT